jgi:hypothetical protein
MLKKSNGMSNRVGETFSPNISITEKNAVNIIMICHIPAFNEAPSSSSSLRLLLIYWWWCDWWTLLIIALRLRCVA